MKNYRELANCIRFLSIDAVQRAKSGHPGMPMGMADIATVLFKDYINFNPTDPEWSFRDRFVLSNGHGSMLLYSLLYLTGYKKMSLEQIKNFRQLGSITAGHPEYEPLAGIEITTGPLGQGIANAVGMALAQKNLTAKLKLKFCPKVYVFCGDGCLQEGISQEAISLAGHLQLDNLILIYDNNKISIDGSTDLSFSDNTNLRFESVNWNVANGDGHDFTSIKKNLDKTLKSKKPILLNFNTTIGFGSPNKSSKASSHGSPLGDEEIAKTRKQLNWNHGDFIIPKYLLKDWGLSHKRCMSFYRSSKKYESKINSFKSRNNLIKLFSKIKKDIIKFSDKQATRKSSEVIIDHLSKSETIIGGSADLTGSNLTKGKSMSIIDKKNLGGQYIHFGVREHGMAGIMNGVASTNFFKIFSGTFLSFADYMKPSLRLAALMKIDPILVFTHDSIGLGEDGPTHQPIEQINMLRSIPNGNVFRPADLFETALCWEAAIQIKDGPSFLCLSRQNLPQISNKTASKKSFNGAYIIDQNNKKNQITIIATGSEVSLALETSKLLKENNISSKVVSMPSSSLFEKQSTSFQKNLLKSSLGQIFVIEAGSTMYWNKFTNEENIFGIDDFGSSAPADQVYKKFGLDPKSISKNIMKGIKKK
ncbi:transketolase [Alphaproteobacteria bacterium]|nr:transketolase [Alphaproteobacteria bacterium]